MTSISQVGMSSLLFCKQLIFYCTKFVDALIWIFLDGSYIDFLICCTNFYFKSTYLVSHILTGLIFLCANTAVPIYAGVAANLAKRKKLNQLMELLPKIKGTIDDYDWDQVQLFSLLLCALHIFT
jgi:hypothetical protein